ncbi:MAG: VOC family protein [Pseudomonadota bacterium]
MGLETLDHVNIRTADVTALANWYARVLGLERGPRPEFPFPGAWLYAGARAVVHLVGVPEAPGADPADLKLEHFAFSASGLAAFRARLDAAGVAHDLVAVTGALAAGVVDLVQLNLRDPDGNHIHVDFPADEARALGLIGG